MLDDRNDPEQSPDVLGYQLGLLDAAARREVEGAFADAATLRRACGRVEAVTAPLRFDRVESPRDLVRSVLDRVEESRSIIPLPRMSSSSERAPQRHYLFSFRELVGLAAAILIFVGLFLPGYAVARRNAQQAACFDNLRNIGCGIIQDTQMAGLTSPVFVAPPAGAPWIATSAETPPFRNSQNLYRLVSSRVIPPAAVYCPGRPDDRPMDARNVQGRADFPTPQNCSYTQALIPTAAAARSLRPDSPTAADLTPLVDQNRRLVQSEALPANSDSHGPSRGQNVLYLDGRVQFHSTPNAGVDNDDIYRVIGVQRYTGFERPQQRSDAFLVP